MNENICKYIVDVSLTAASKDRSEEYFFTFVVFIVAMMDAMKFENQSSTKTTLTLNYSHVNNFCWVKVLNICIHKM